MNHTKYLRNRHMEVARYLKGRYEPYLHAVLNARRLNRRLLVENKLRAV